MLFQKSIQKILDEFPDWKSLSVGDEERRSVYIDHNQHKELGFLNHKKTIDILSKGTTLSSQGVDRVDGPYGDKSVDMENMMEAYIKERGDSNLMEHVDKYNKRAVLMEGAMKKFFEMFDQGKTDEEIVQDYAQKGTTVPEPFVTKARRQYEGMKKLKLELEMSEKEFRNSSEKMVNNAEEGMEYEGEEKTLASGLTNEEPNEGNAFGLAMQKAKEDGDDSFELDGETFKVEK